MDQPQAMIKTMVLEEPSDFDVAVRVARRVFKWNESALTFAASSDASRVLFVEMGQTGASWWWSLFST